MFSATINCDRCKASVRLNAHKRFVVPPGWATVIATQEKPTLNDDGGGTITLRLDKHLCPKCLPTFIESIDPTP